MIINTGSRTDIPAFFSKWFYNRIKEGYVLVRNPYFQEQVTKYTLTPGDKVREAEQKSWIDGQMTLFDFL